MNPTPRVADAAEFDGGLLVLGRFAGTEPSELERRLDAALDGQLGGAADRLRFRARPGQVVGIDSLGRLPARRVLVIGLGPRDDIDLNGWRNFAASAVEHALTEHDDSIGLAITHSDSLGAIVEGLELRLYRFDQLKSDDPDDPTPSIERAELLLAEPVDEAERTVERARAVARGVVLARTLVNEPPNVCTPRRLAAVAKEIATAPNMTLTVLDRDAIAAKKMGGMIGVSQGSDEPPQFIHIAYTPPGSDPAEAICLVGKGLTFDSGGLSLKPPKSMMNMHIDMGGSASVLGAMQIVGELQPSVPVHGIVAAAENMPSARSYRPSDILTMYNGKTVEVLNTDAEGRLVLADALHYATELRPRFIVDLATLTGACLVGLGTNYAGLFTDREDVAGALLTAAERAGEHLWRMPLDKQLAEQLKSKRADLKNIGGQWGGAITAALFLREFVGDTPWAHLDIAGPTEAEKDEGYIRAGGTGYGVAMLWSLINGGGLPAVAD